MGQMWGPSPFLTRWVLTGIVRPKVTKSAIVWANKVINYNMHLDRVQRLGMLAMTHVHCSTPTAGLEAALDVMPLDFYAQCIAVQAILRVWNRNQSSWDGIGCSHLRGHLFWGDKTLKGVEIKGDCTDKREKRKRTSFMAGGRRDGLISQHVTRSSSGWSTPAAWAMPFHAWIV